MTTNFVGDDYAVLNGAPTFITLVDRTPRPHDVRLELPSGWAGAMTALEPAADRAPLHYRAADYDTLVDSPIVAGNPVVQDFEVDGSRHHVVEIGDVSDFDGARAARDLKDIVEAHATHLGRAAVRDVRLPAGLQARRRRTRAPQLRCWPRRRPPRRGPRPATSAG